MKVYQLSKNNVSLKSFILQLQLSLEFSQINEILSTYSEALLFLTEYSFLFETFFKETPSLKNTHTNFKSSFSSPDPARDGVNWYAYCSNNPISFLDPDGLEDKPAVYPTVGNAFNLDFGRDYSTMAVQNFKNGHPILGSIQMLDSACEIVYDLAAAYGVANLVGKGVAILAGNQLQKAGESINSGTEYARVDNISNVEKYGQNLGKDGQLFLTDAKTINSLDLTTKSGLQNAEQVLGLPKGQLSNSSINVVTTVNTSGLNVRLPTSGNEFFIPGGVTSGGAPEIVVNPMNIFTDSAVTSIQFIQQVE